MDWIEKYEKTTKDYRLTKTKSVTSVKLSFIYTVDTSLPIVNESVKNLEIKDIVNVNYTLKEPSVLSKDELLEEMMDLLDALLQNQYITQSQHKTLYDNYIRYD